MSKLRMSKVNSPATGASFSHVVTIQNAQLVDEAQAAAYVGRSASYLSGARTGRGTPGPDYLRIGRSIAYTVADLKKWVEKNPPKQQGRVTNATQAMTGRRKAG